MHEPYRTQKGWQGRMHALPPERSDNNRHHAEYARKTRNGRCGKVCAPNPSGIVSETSSLGLADRQADSQRSVVIPFLAASTTIARRLALHNTSYYLLLLL